MDKPTTKEKKFNKLKYKIISKVETAPGSWDVVYEVWEGCYCSRETKKATVSKNRLPLLKDLIRALS